MRQLLADTLLALVSFASVAAFAASESTQIWHEEVLVVGARDVRHIEDVAATVDVIDRNAIVGQVAGSLREVVRYVPGVSVVDADNRFGATEISLRGLSGNRVVSLIDGVPVADQFDVGAFSNAGQDWLVPDSVSRIEILRGPASTLFGSDALGGVIAIISRDPEEYLGRANHAETMSLRFGGADASLGATGSFAGVGERASMVVQASRMLGEERQSSATSRVDELERERRSLSATVAYAFQPGHTLRLRADLFAETVDTDMSAVLGFGRRYRNTTDLRGDDERERRSLSLSYDFEADSQWLDSGAIRVFDQHTAVRQETYENRLLASGNVALERAFDFDVRARGVTIDFRSPVETWNASHRIGWGVHYQQSRYAEFRDGRFTDLVTGASSNVLLGEIMPVRDFPDSTVSELGLYVHDEIELGPVTLIPAVRYERHDLGASNDLLYAGAVVVDDRVSSWAPKFGIIWRLSNDLVAFAQYAQGFKAPPFEDVNIGLDIPLFNYRAIPNPTLKAETSDGLDVGIRGKWQHARLSVAAFHARYDNFIQSRAIVGRDPVTSTLLFQSINIDEAEIYGIEFDGALDLDRWIRNMSIAAKLSWTRGEDKQANVPLEAVNPLEMVVSASWAASERTTLAVYGTLVRRQRNTDQPDAFLPPGFGVWDLTLNFKPDTRTRIDVGIFNLGDKTHWRWGSVRGRTADDPLVDVLAQPGRHASVSIERRLGG